MTTNRHDDHEATCICCEHFKLMYEPDWSEITPGEGFKMLCREGVYDHTRAYYGPVHLLQSIGATCKLFKGRKT
jgi:hypothetical protein